MTRATFAIAVAALAGAATLATGGSAHAACPPHLNPRFCDVVVDPIPDRCYYYPETGDIVCEWDR